MKPARIKGKKGCYYIQFLNKNRRWENHMIKLPVGLYRQLAFRTKKRAKEFIDNSITLTSTGSL